jgi:hypothetical protein
MIRTTLTQERYCAVLDKLPHDGQLFMEQYCPNSDSALLLCVPSSGNYYIATLQLNTIPPGVFWIDKVTELQPDPISNWLHYSVINPKYIVKTISISQIPLLKNIDNINLEDL